MKLAKGMKIVADGSYEKFDEDEFKQHLASIINDEPDDSQNQMGEPMIIKPKNLNEHSSGEGGMDQPARVQIDPTQEESL